MLWVAPAQRSAAWWCPWRCVSALNWYVATRTHSKTAQRWKCFHLIFSRIVFEISWFLLENLQRWGAAAAAGGAEEVGPDQWTEWAVRLFCSEHIILTVCGAVLCNRSSSRNCAVVALRLGHCWSSASIYVQSNEKAVSLALDMW